VAEPLTPGSVIGIMGGGQLGRMLAIAAARIGLSAHVFDPGEDPPAAHVARAHLRAAFDDAEALVAFAAGVDAITFEFENVPADTADILARHAPVRPNGRALATAQDRVTEKTFLNDLGIATAPWRAVDGPEDVEAARVEIGRDGILKTRRFGYDGKGQARVSAETPPAGAWAEIGARPAIYEGLVPFLAEISVIAARGGDGEVVAYDPGLNVHREGILHTTTVPAPIPRAAAQEAVLIAGRILNALDYVGVMGVEMFVTPGGLLVNEIAPRVHNSGHWTMEACLQSQFDTHIRAVAGWPLGDGARHSDAVMTNLIGDEADAWRTLAGEPAGLHLYGKAEARPGRKMGHVTRIAPRSG